jgi:myo-inositol catabolism protein IolH
VKIALDPYMLRRVPLLRLPRLVAELGYQYIEMSPRDDFLPFFLHPRIDDAGVAAFKRELAAAEVEVASVLPLYRWSGPDEDERQAAVRYWKRAIQLTVDLDCRVMNSEFNGRPEAASRSEAQFWRSMEELPAGLRAGGDGATPRAPPDDFVEDGRTAVDMVRGIDSSLVSFLYCAPHTFHMGGRHHWGDGVRRRPAHPPARGRLLRPPRVVRAALHRETARVRPPGCTSTWTSGRARWTGRSSSAPSADEFDGIMTVCVFAWEERARESCVFNRETIEGYLKNWG